MPSNVALSPSSATATPLPLPIKAPNDADSQKAAAGIIRKVP